MPTESKITLARIMQALRESDIGEGISDAAIEKIASISNLLSLDKGEVLTEEGAEGHHAYIILSGSIEVQLSVDDPSNPATTRTLLPGSIIGEMSILENYRRTARTIAAEPSSMLCLLDEELWTVFDADPIAGYTFMRNLARILSKRLRVTNLAIRHSFFAE